MATRLQVIYNGKAPQPLPTPQSAVETGATEPTSLDNDPQRTLPSQGESGTYGEGSEDGAEHEAGDDREADRNLARDR